MTFLSIPDNFILAFFYNKGYSPGKGYKLVISNKNEEGCYLAIIGKATFNYHITLTHVGYLYTENVAWVKYLYEEFGEPYKEAFLKQSEKELF